MPEPRHELWDPRGEAHVCGVGDDVKEAWEKFCKARSEAAAECIRELTAAPFPQGFENQQHTPLKASEGHFGPGPVWQWRVTGMERVLYVRAADGQVEVRHVGPPL